MVEVPPAEAAAAMPARPVLPSLKVPALPPPPEEAEVSFRQGLIFHKERRYAEAAEWYRKAAEQGVPTAQNNLAVLYAEGQGVAQDYVAAHMWFAVAGAAKTDKNQANLELLENHMTAEQIVEAHRRAQLWLDQHALRGEVAK